MTHRGHVFLRPKRQAVVAALSVVGSQSVVVFLPVSRPSTPLRGGPLDGGAPWGPLPLSDILSLSRSRWALCLQAVLVMAVGSAVYFSVDKVSPPVPPIPVREPFPQRFEREAK